jgi:hypothetical protein
MVYYNNINIRTNMFSLLTYPFDVIKTNRILQTSLSKEAGGSIPNELSALYERGGLFKGLYRGLLCTLALNYSNDLIFIPTKPNLVFGALIAAFVNPFNVMQVNK